MERRSVSAIAALADDLRRGLYAFIRRAGRPVTREEAAENAGISRKLAAFHLDKLVHVGLLKSDHRAPPDRGGRPGRSPKVYEPSDLEISVSIPQRRYELVGDILVDAVAEADGDARGAALRTAARRGREIGETVRATTDGRPARPLRHACAVLERLGYEPAVDAHPISLRNCPFPSMVERQPELVCCINRAFCDGMLRGLGDETTRTALVPGPGRCCVELHAG